MGLEKCRLLTRLLGQNVENLDHYGCSKIQDLVKPDNAWICSSYLFRRRRFLTLFLPFLTEDRLRYRTNTGSIPSKFYIPDRLKQSKTLTLNTQNLSTLQVIQSFSHKCINLFLQSCPEEFIPFLCEWIKKLLKANLQSIKRQHVAKFQIEVWLLSLN